MHLVFLCKKGAKGRFVIIFNVHYKYLYIYYLLCLKKSLMLAKAAFNGQGCFLFKHVLKFEHSALKAEF